MSRRVKATVVGSGAWGTALAVVLTQKGHDVTIWSYEEDVAASINAGDGNRYLADIALPSGLRADTDLGRSLDGAEVVVSATPSQFVRGVMEAAAPHISSDVLLVSASKGIELGSLLRMDQVLSEVLPGSIMDRFCVLSGPSFAAEVAQGAPTAVVVASRDEAAAVRARDVFITPSFRVYTNTDVVGVELGGVLKNVVALAAGVSAGLGYGQNTLAALITRGLAEITRFGVAAGADKATFYGLAGVGDLVLTCTGSLSRNRTVGYKLGKGEALDDIIAQMSAVAEGVKAAEAVQELARRHAVEMPIMEQMYAIVHEGQDPSEALRTLMSREPKPEDWS
jgi:glycerol-3-phosphate dehydrogenase (NAD(P)+)